MTLTSKSITNNVKVFGPRAEFDLSVFLGGTELLFCFLFGYGGAEVAMRSSSLHGKGIPSVPQLNHEQKQKSNECILLCML